ncbi:diacylglycerol kinase iota-like, partial [Lampetra planeri]
RASGAVHVCSWLFRCSCVATPPERLRIRISRIRLHDYEELRYHKDRLREASVPVGVIVVPGDCDLDTCREHIERLQEDLPAADAALPRLPEHEGEGRTRILSSQKLSPKWCFLDSTSADRFFRIDRMQEQLHFLSDMSAEELFVLDPETPRPASVSSGAAPGMPDLVEPSPGVPSPMSDSELLRRAAPPCRPALLFPATPSGSHFPLRRRAVGFHVPGARRRLSSDGCCVTDRLSRQHSAPPRAHEGAHQVGHVDCYESSVGRRTAGVAREADRCPLAGGRPPGP